MRRIAANVQHCSCRRSAWARTPRRRRRPPALRPKPSPRGLVRSYYLASQEYGRGVTHASIRVTPAPACSPDGPRLRCASGTRRDPAGIVRSGANDSNVAPDVLILRVESVLCIVAALCAAVYAVLRRRRPVRISGFTVAGLSLLIVSEVVGAAMLDATAPAGASSGGVRPTPVAISSRQAAPAPPAEPLGIFRAAWADA